MGECVGGSVVGWGDGLWVGILVGDLVGTAVTGLSVGECVGGSVIGWGDGLWVGILVGIRVVGRDYTFMFMMPCAVTIHCPKETTQNG